MNVIPLDPEGHSRVQALLPWYVTGRLEDNERVQVEAHLAGCARCRAELALERQLHATQAAPDDADAGAADHGFARLRQRLAKTPPRLPWWGWALGLQFAAIAVLGVALALLLARPAGAPYRGLGGAGTGANAIVMFSPDATETQIRQALHAVDARLVGGPTTTRAYLLALPFADAGMLARLRGQPGVTMAESLAAEATP